LQAILSPNSGLQQLASLLPSIDAQLGTNFRENIFPQQGNMQQAARMLWFMANVEQGENHKFLPDSLKQALQKADHGDVVDKVRQEFALLRNVAEQPNQQGWHTLVMPFHDGEKLRYAMAYSKKLKDKKGKDQGWHFVVEVALENLGDMQMEGMVKASEHERAEMSLMIRTRAALTEKIRDDIRTIMRGANEATGQKGGVSFQVVRQFPLNPGAVGGGEEFVI